MNVTAEPGDKESGPDSGISRTIFIRVKVGAELGNVIIREKKGSEEIIQAHERKGRPFFRERAPAAPLGPKGPA